MAALACKADCPAALTCCLDKYSVDVNASVEESRTLLAVAATEAASKCVAVLLIRGARVNKTHKRSGSVFSPLYCAAERGNIAVCRQLVDAGVAMDVCCDSDQWSTLHVAARHGHLGVVSLLMQRRADTRATGPNQCTPIFVACEAQHILVVKALLPHAELSHVNISGASLLHNAVEFGGPAMLEVVLPRFAEAGLVDIPTGVDARLSHLPAGHPLRGTALGITPLQLACRRSKYAEAKLLLKAGASRHATDAMGGSGLHHCIGGTSKACLELLLGKAPDWHYTPEQLNAAGMGGSTALHWAAIAGSAENCKLLIAAGADPHATTSEGQTCLDLARQ